MHRRSLLIGAGCWPLLPALHAHARDIDAGSIDEAPAPHLLVSSDTLLEALSARFPLRFDLGGVLQVQVSAPRLLLLPERQKAGAVLVAQSSGPGLQQTQPGEADIVFALRYEPGDRSVRAARPEILGLRLPGVPRDTVQALQMLLPAIAADALGEIVLHRFTQRELALPETMGFEPDRVQVVNEGLLVTFARARHP